jgi:hypothetical protein
VDLDLLKYGNCYHEIKDGEVIRVDPTKVSVKGSVYTMDTKCRCRHEVIPFNASFSVVDSVWAGHCGFHSRNRVPPNFIIVSEDKIALFKKGKSFQGLPDGYVSRRRFELGDLATKYGDAERLGALHSKWVIYTSTFVASDQIVLGYKCPVDHILTSSEITKKNFLECMFGNLDDLEDGTDEEVEEELREMGIDVEKARAGLDAIIAKYKERDK